MCRDANAERKRARLRRLFPVWETVSDLIEVPDWRVLGISPAYEAKCAAELKSLAASSAMITATVLTPIPAWR